jgi:hypothetical protein
MTFRRLAALALALATVGALAAGCSSDDKAAKAPRKTTSTTIATPPTVTDAEFEKAVASSEALIEDAGTDACKLLQIFSQASVLPSPANPQQTKQGVQVVVDLFRATTAAQPTPSPADAALLNQAADGLLAEGAQKGWDPAWLPKAASISDPKVGAAFQDYQQSVHAVCNPTATTTP